MGLEVLLIEIQTNHHQSFHGFTFNSVLSVKCESCRHFQPGEGPIVGAFSTFVNGSFAALVAALPTVVLACYQWSHALRVGQS